MTSAYDSPRHLYFKFPFWHPLLTAGVLSLSIAAIPLSLLVPPAPEELTSGLPSRLGMPLGGFLLLMVFGLYWHFINRTFDWDEEGITAHAPFYPSARLRWDEFDVVRCGDAIEGLTLKSTARKAWLWIPFSYENMIPFRSWLAEHYQLPDIGPELTRAMIDQAKLPSRHCLMSRRQLIVHWSVIIVPPTIVFWFSPWLVFSILLGYLFSLPFLLRDTFATQIVDVSSDRLVLESLSRHRVLSIGEVGKLEFRPGVRSEIYPYMIVGGDVRELLLILYDTSKRPVFKCRVVGQSARRLHAALTKAIEDYCLANGIDPATRIVPAPPPRDETAT